MKFLSKNPQQTLQLGRLIGKQTRPGDVLLLTGELGGGKTLFTKGVADAIGIPIDLVVSPSFTLVFEYYQGKFPLFHMDFYRLTSLDELYDLGMETYLTEDGLLVIEWADRVADFVTESMTINFILQEQQRVIEISTENPRWQEIINNIELQ